MWNSKAPSLVCQIGLGFKVWGLGSRVFGVRVPNKLRVSQFRWQRGFGGGWQGKAAILSECLADHATQISVQSRGFGVKSGFLFRAIKSEVPRIARGLSPCNKDVNPTTISGHLSGTTTPEALVFVLSSNFETLTGVPQNKTLKWSKPPMRSRASGCPDLSTLQQLKLLHKVQVLAFRI